jgi:amicyanin
VIAAVLALTGCGGDDAGSSSGGGGKSAVAIEDFKFMPARVQVDAGTTVTWTNRDSAPHTATADDDALRQKFDTRVIKQKASASVTFDKPGTYAYVCDLHPFMKATVVVR